MSQEFEALAARVLALEDKSVNHEKRLDSHGQRLRRVENRVNAQLMTSIQTDVASGMKSKDVAAKHGVKPVFVSYVAPRSQFAPGAQQPLH